MPHERRDMVAQGMYGSGRDVNSMQRATGDNARPFFALPFEPRLNASMQPLDDTGVLEDPL